MPLPANQSADHDASPTSMTAAPASLGGEDANALSLCLLPEDDNELVLDSDEELDNNEAEEEEEDSETNTVTEVEASERALKFKISTEAANATSSSFSGTSLLSGCHSNSNIGGRKSYPGSRKGSRERVVISSAINQHQQQSFVHPNYRAPAKLQKTIGTLSFDHQYHHHPQHLQHQDGAVVSQNQVAPSMDKRGSAVSCYSSCIAGGGGNNSVVGMVGGRLVFGGGVAGGVGQISKRVADDDDGGGGESCDGDMVADGAKEVVGSATSTGGSNVCVDTSEQQSKNPLTSTSAATTTTTATPTPTTNPPTNSTPSHTKRTTNFLLKLSTLKRQNSNKSSSKIKTTDKSTSHNGTDNSMVVSPAGPIVDVDNGKAKDNSELPVDKIRNNLECTLRSTNKKQDVIKVDLDGDTDVSTALQQREKIVPSSSTAKSTTAHQSLGSGGSSFLSRFKHFTYDRLGLLSSSGTLDKDYQHHKEDVAGQKPAALKNHSLTRMTLPLIRHKHRHATTTNVTQDASSTYCKSLDNVDQTNQTDHLLTDDHHRGGGHHHQRLHKASTLPKMRKLGFGGKKHWKFFLLGGGGSGGGGSKRHSTLARDGGGGGGETVEKTTMVDDGGNKSCAWSSDCDVAISAGKWENVGGGNDNGGSQRSIPSTSTSAHVTMTEYYARVLKKKQQQQQKNKVTTTTRTTTGGIGGGESVVDEQCCRARPTKSPPPPPLPITMAPSLNSRGGNATLTAALPSIIGSAEVATM